MRLWSKTPWVKVPLETPETWIVFFVEFPIIIAWLSMITVCISQDQECINIYIYINNQYICWIVTWRIKRTPSSWFIHFLYSKTCFPSLDKLKPKSEFNFPPSYGSRVCFLLLITGSLRISVSLRIDRSSGGIRRKIVAENPTAHLLCMGPRSPAMERLVGVVRWVFMISNGNNVEIN